MGGDLERIALCRRSCGWRALLCAVDFAAFEWGIVEMVVELAGIGGLSADVYRRDFGGEHPILVLKIVDLELLIVFHPVNVVCCQSPSNRSSERNYPK